MKKLLLVAAVLTPMLTHAQLEWRISFKVFTDNNGALPRLPYWNLGGTNLFQEFSNGVNYANSILTNTGRGYRFRLTEIVLIPGMTSPLPAATNSWFNLPVTAASHLDLDAKAWANPGPFQYRADAVNIYYADATNGTHGGFCATPADGLHLITLSPLTEVEALPHELGHFFSLHHTHEGEQFLNSDGSACAAGCDCALRLAGDDDTPETAPDNHCFTTRNDVALGAYFAPYSTLNPDQQWRVDNALFNVMSYHVPSFILTDDQMDFMTETSNNSRLNVANGRTRFVDRSHGGVQNGSRANPFLSIGQGVLNANPGDIVLIRPGHYNEPGTFNKAVTLRATRGEVTVGSP